MSQRGVDRRAGESFQDEGQDGFTHRAFLRGLGRTMEDARARPVIGIANSASDLNPCNSGLDQLAAEVRRGIEDAGGLALEFPTISISEPFTRPTSLYLRNLMSMDVEEMILASPIDGVVLLGGCDKTIPAQLMGAVSAGKPAVAVAAGPRPVSCFQGNCSFTIDDVWEQIDARRAGELGDEAWAELEDVLIPGPGTCNVMGTATTMAMVAEVLGFALPGSTLAPAASLARAQIAYQSGRRVVERTLRDETPSMLVTPESMENALRVVNAVGGSTNALIHLEAIAGRAGFRLGVENVSRWSRSTPLIADVRPTGRRLLSDLEAAGGVPSVLKRIRHLVHEDCVAGDGTTWAKVLDDVPDVDNPALTTAERPLRANGGLMILTGSLAPRGAVLKVGPHDSIRRIEGRCVVFDGLDDLHARIDDPDLQIDADSILVLRGMGPKGAPGMPEVGHIPIPARLRQQGVRDMVRISDARMSGTSTGTVVLHVAPESADGGPLGRLHTGDTIIIDPESGVLDHTVPTQQFQARLPPPNRIPPARGYARLHDEHVLQADEGCDLDFLRHRQTPRSAPSGVDPAFNLSEVAR